MLLQANPFVASRAIPASVANHNALVVVAWERKIVETMVQNFLSAYGGDSELAWRRF
jgi:hypothetical protein